MSWSRNLSETELADLESMGPAVAGSYVLLVFHLRRFGAVPFDEAVLTGVARCTRRAWNDKIWPAIGDRFQVGDDGFLRHSDPVRAS
jgi:hypothetical protein